MRYILYDEKLPSQKISLTKRIPWQMILPMVIEAQQYGTTFSFFVILKIESESAGQNFKLSSNTTDLQKIKSGRKN